MATPPEKIPPLFSKEQIRAVIKFNALVDRKSIDIRAEFVKVMGEDDEPEMSTVRR